MSDRLMKHPLSQAEQLKLKREHREQHLVIKTLVQVLGRAAGSTNPKGVREVRIAADTLRSIDAFAPLSIYKDQISGDVLLVVGDGEQPAQWVKLDTFGADPLDEARTLLYQASPHLVNGANAHPTDRADARRILREMKKIGIDVDD